VAAALKQRSVWTVAEEKPDYAAWLRR